MNKRVSVVMATYNGEKYIYDQLLSIYMQTQIPDEVIICDDASSDKTVLIIKEFIKKKKLEQWKLYENKENMGWRKNFFSAIQKASGELVFFSDQDDVWRKDKIERMSNIMEEKGAEALVGKAIIIDEMGNQLKRRNEQKFFKKDVKKVAFTNYFYAEKTLGCCLCVRRNILNIYLELKCPQCGHDSQCGKLALLFGSLWELDDAVIKYRIHNGNSSGISAQYSYGASSLERRIEDLRNDIEWVRKLLIYPSISLTGKKNNLKRCKEAMIIRYNYLTNRRGISLISLFRYYDCYRGIGMLIGDYAYKHKINKLLGKIRWNLGKCGIF